MTVTRRNFLRSGAISVLLTGLALETIPQVFARQRQRQDPSQDFQTPPEVKGTTVFTFKRETFQPYIGGVFTLRAGEHTVQATLRKVRDCTPNPKSGVTKRSRPSDCFALIFEAEGKLTDLTTIYDVEHAALGRFALFLSYREGPHGTSFYEAVFNHAL